MGWPKRACAVQPYPDIIFPHITFAPPHPLEPRGYFFYVPGRLKKRAIRTKGLLPHGAKDKLTPDGLSPPSAVRLLLTFFRFSIVFDFVFYVNMLRWGGGCRRVTNPPCFSFLIC